MTEYTNSHGYRFRDGLVIAPQGEATHTAHTFEPSADEPQHSYDRHVSHASYAHVMETMVAPVNARFAYQPGMYVYVHGSAYCDNPLDSLECLITDVSGAPLRIMVQPCNHPEQAHEVRQDQLSAPILV